ncbi:MAG: CaiB/BaiF CoA transferase family protein [Alphaproteobacteria bacterium]
MPLQPLKGIRVLDFTTLLPGPMAALIMAEAGAEVIKIERPGSGEDMRHYDPPFADDSVNFALLNRGKKSIAVDLKDKAAVEKVKKLVATADVVLEQFRPGVMDRLGLGYDALKAVNPKIVYCAITGYGQDGPKAMVAAHDMNYIGDTGMLSLSTGADGAPIPPPGLIADIGAGTMPTVINVLLGLQHAQRTGEGCYLDIAMTDGLWAWEYWAMGRTEHTGVEPKPGGELVTGGTPRYRLYRTKDDRFVAAAPIEQKFWENFCALIGLPDTLRDDSRDPAATTQGIAGIIATKTAAEWDALFAGKDLCCSIVRTMKEAMSDPHFKARGLFDNRVSAGPGQASLTALPLPLAPVFKERGTTKPYPKLGDANALLDEV